MVDGTGQAGDPDAYLDYDPLPYELTLRRAYVARGWVLAGNGLEEAEDAFDARHACVKLLDEGSPLECGIRAEED